jgi:hypothetical protein
LQADRVPCLASLQGRGHWISRNVTIGLLATVRDPPLCAAVATDLTAVDRAQIG